jgi:hypothetical protein
MISSQIKESNPNCAATFASLRLYGDFLIPDEINRLLQIEPSDSATKGTEITGAPGHSRKAPTGRWILSTERNVQSTNLELHIEWILERLETIDIQVEKLPGVERADIFCYWNSASGHGGPEFSPELMGRLARSGLALGLDIYFTH